MLPVRQAFQPDLPPVRQENEVLNAKNVMIRAAMGISRVQFERHAGADDYPGSTNHNRYQT